MWQLGAAGASPCPAQVPWCTGLDLGLCALLGSLSGEAQQSSGEQGTRDQAAGLKLFIFIIIIAIVTPAVTFQHCFLKFLKEHSNKQENFLFGFIL